MCGWIIKARSYAGSSEVSTKCTLYPPPESQNCYCWAQLLSTSVSKGAATRCEPRFSTQQGPETFAWGLGKEAELQPQLGAKSDPPDTALLLVPRAQGCRAIRSQLCSLRPDRLAPQFLAPESGCLGFLGSHPHLLPADSGASPGPNKLSPLTLRFCTAP